MCRESHISLSKLGFSLLCEPEHVPKVPSKVNYNVNVNVNVTVQLYNAHSLHISRNLLVAQFVVVVVAAVGQFNLVCLFVSLLNV